MTNRLAIRSWPYATRRHVADRAVGGGVAPTKVVDRVMIEPPRILRR